MEMGLTCGCMDFDKGEVDSWYEPGRRNFPSAGERCCECNAPLPSEKKAACIITSEWFDPEFVPPDPDDEEALGFPPYPSYGYSRYTSEQAEEIFITSALWEESYGPAWDFYHQQWDDWARDNGYDGEYGRCERVILTEYRCERCQGLAEAYEELGYCMIAPGELIDTNVGYAHEHSGVNLKWVADATGTLNPVRQQEAA